MNLIRYLNWHRIFYDNISTNQIYLDENLYPLILLNDIIPTNNLENDFSENTQDEIFSIANIAYKLITGKNLIIENSLNMSSIRSKFLQKFIQKCWSNFKYQRPILYKAIGKLYTHKEEFGTINNIELTKYETIIKSFLTNYLNEIEKLDSKNRFYLWDDISLFQ